MKMFKTLTFIPACLALLAMPVHAQSACRASAGVVQLSNAQIGTVLRGNTVCGVPGASYPGSPVDRFQEEHLINGDLFDFKRGPGHPVDPREKVGTWALGGNAADVPTVTHRYGPSTTFTWTVFGPAINSAGTSVYSFCSGDAEHVRAHVIPTGSGCASFPTASTAAQAAPKVTTGKTPPVVTPK
jgi:hypothetical protein